MQQLPLTGWDRAMAAAEDVKERMQRAVDALSVAGVPYAVIGGNAVAEWVGSVDREAVRSTRDVDIMIRRPDLDAAKAALSAVGFIYRHAASIDMFLDGVGAKASKAVHILYANEKVRTDAVAASPDLTDAVQSTTGRFQVIGLQSLVTMKLTSYRDKDRTHLRDLLGVGLIDDTWPARFPPPLGERLQAILDTPDG